MPTPPPPSGSVLDRDSPTNPKAEPGSSGQPGELREAVAVPRPRSRLSRAMSEAPAYLSTRLGRCWASARAAWWRLRARGALRRTSSPIRICLGAGSAPIPDWINCDLEPGVDVRLDLRFPLPFPDGSVDLVYSEHLIEHLSADEGLALLTECRRVLRDDGVLRVATPDLEELVRAYQEDWRAQDWVRWPGHEWIDSPAMMLNVAFRSWGHRHLYDHTELTKCAAAAGFARTRRCALGASTVADLAGLETREDSTLIIEAWGAAPGRIS